MYHVHGRRIHSVKMSVILKLINSMKFQLKTQWDKATWQIANIQNKVGVFIESSGGDKYAISFQPLFSLIQSHPKIYMNEQRE